MKYVAAAFISLFCWSANAQQHSNQTQYPTAINLGAAPTAAPAQSAPSQHRMTVDDVVKLSKAGISDDVIVQQIVKNGQRFDLSTDDLLQLKNAGVSNRVIGAMINPMNASNAQVEGNAQNSIQSHADPAPTPQVIPADARSFAAPAGAPALPLVATKQSTTGPRVYFTSESKGSQWNAARNQSMEMSKDFEKDCPGTKITINQSAADYTVLLNHIEHGFARDNQVQVANKDGDLISRTKEGGSIRGDMKKVCQVILANWNKP